jgi:putative ABC transport system ATP-binding protein
MLDLRRGKIADSFGVASPSAHKLVDLELAAAHGHSHHIELRNVEKAYKMGKREYQALRGVDLVIEPGEFVAIVGPSGSGKSTILNMITGIDRPTAGSVLVGAKDLGKLSENVLAKWRGEQIGIVFQFFQLLPTLTALENVALPLHLRGRKSKYLPAERLERAMANLKLVAMDNHAQHLPSELSGGEQQRVAVARALANDPPIIVADEPTGNLDTSTGEMIFDIFRKLAAQGKTIIYVTHDQHLAAQADRLIQVRDGKLLSDSKQVRLVG